MQPTKQSANIEEFLWNMHTMLVAAPGPVQLENVKEQYLKHHGHKCAVERFLVVGDGGLSATLRRIPHVCNVSVKEGVTYVKAAQPADIDRNQLIEEDKRYRREVAKKNAAKAAAMGTSKAKAPAPAGGAPAPNEQGKRPAEDAGSGAEKKQRTEAEAETLARMLIQGVVRILQNRQRANKGALPMSELENEFKELWKVPFNVKQANENDPVEFLRKWPSKVEIVPQGDSFLVQLAKKPVAKAAPEEPAKNGPAKPPGQKPPQNIQDFLWNLHTLLHARGGIPIAQLKDVYLTHFGHKCAIERFLVVAEGGLLATFKRIPHIIQIDKEPDHMLRPSLPGGATREELLAEDEKYRKSLQQKMAAKAAKAAETPKAPSPEGPTGDKKHDNETLQRMLIQGVIRVLQNRAKEGKGPLPLADLEKEFEAAWKVPFNCQQAGERDAVQFLQKWNTKVDVYQENGRDVVALAKKPHEKAKATAVKAPPAKAGSNASAPSPEASQRADVDLFGRPLGATPSLPELTETAKGMLQNMKDLVVQQEALVKALTSLQK